MASRWIPQEIKLKVAKHPAGDGEASRLFVEVRGASKSIKYFLHLWITAVYWRAFGSPPSTYVKKRMLAQPVDEGLQAIINMSDPQAVYLAISQFVDRGGLVSAEKQIIDRFTATGPDLGYLVKDPAVDDVFQQAEKTNSESVSRVG